MAIDWKIFIEKIKILQICKVFVKLLGNLESK